MNGSTQRCSDLFARVKPTLQNRKRSQAVRLAALVHVDRFPIHDDGATGEMLPLLTWCERWRTENRF